MKGVNNMVKKVVSVKGFLDRITKDREYEVIKEKPSQYLVQDNLNNYLFYNKSLFRDVVIEKKKVKQKEISLEKE